MTEENAEVVEEVKPPKTTRKSKAKADTKSEEAPVETPVPVVVKSVKLFSFEQWASRKQIPKHHHGGLRAFVNNINKHRTLEEWEQCFEAY